jgi:PPK2 family polyphosphate:nucleotide phosphotransferase
MSKRSFMKDLRIEPGAKVKLSKYDANDDLGWDKDKAEACVDENRDQMAELHDLLWASGSHALLIVLQGMDTCGKDGTVRHVMTGLNPQGCNVTSFKAPSPLEMSHDYLWRVHNAVPARGSIGVFNRSHYEDVLVTRVTGLIKDSEAKHRYEQINAFEQYLSENNVRVLKFFLHISRDEQRERLQARLTDRRKNWKFSESDLEARANWDEYQDVYGDMLGACSTTSSPWYIVPANRKWLRNLVVSQIVAQTMGAFDMKWPKPKVDLSKVKIPK